MCRTCEELLLRISVIEPMAASSPIPRKIPGTREPCRQEGSGGGLSGTLGSGIRRFGFDGITTVYEQSP
jgi:hypothetical protein